MIFGTIYIFWIKKTLLGFLCVDTWGSSSFILTTVWYFIIWMYHSLLLHSPDNGHLGYFKFFTITSNTSINILYTCLHTSCESFSEYTKKCN